MKLRNKHTGEIWDIPKKRYPTVQEDDISFFVERECEGKLFSYKSIAELLADWEDVEITEPLIKDEKIRKAVRAWADTYEIVAVRHIVLRYDKTKHSVFETGYGNDYSAITLETELDFVDGDTYSIAELCGEDEE